MGARRKARVIAFQALYSWEMNGTSREELLSLDWLPAADKAKLTDDVAAFARILVAGYFDNQEEVDLLIKKNIQRWEFERIGRVDLAILRIGVYSLIYLKDIPASITIDEAINIAKQYSAGESYRFINGVLDSIQKNNKA